MLRGQALEYFDTRANTARSGQLLELRRKQALVLDTATGQRWLIPYAAINPDGADVDIREKPRQGLGRNEVAIGDRVGFVGRDQQVRKALRTCGRRPALQSADVKQALTTEARGSSPPHL